VAEQETTVEDFLSMIKDSKDTTTKYKCVLIRKLDSAEIPDNMYEALKQAILDDNVSNVKILSFIKNNTKAKVNLTNIQDHRRKAGCVVCLYGSATQ